MRVVADLAQRAHVSLSVALVAACATVVDATDLRVVQQPEVDCHILNMDEVTLLSAGAVTVASLEQPHRIAGLELLLHVEGHTRHAPFVLLTRAVHVEVAKAHHRALDTAQQQAQVFIKQELGECIDVERVLVAPVFPDWVVA